MQAFSESLDSLPLLFEAGEEVVGLIGVLITYPVGNSTERNGNFVSDGSNAIVKTGDEYFNIFPAWNWTRIPGTTAPQMPDVPLGKNARKLRGTSQLAGGVNDSLYGATTYFIMIHMVVSIHRRARPGSSLIMKWYVSVPASLRGLHTM